MSALAAAMLAIVTQNQASLRAAPRDSSPQQAILWQGELVELRSGRGDFFYVYDHRIERGGYLRASQLRPTALSPDEAPELLAVMRFLRDTPGSEALGISYAAAYIKVVAPPDLTAEPFDALGTMAERLAQRASIHQLGPAATMLEGQLAVVAQLGIHMTSIEHDGSVRLCYDGEMFRRVLAMPSAEPNQQARAALGLTRHDCVDPNLGFTARYQLDQWRLDVLDRVPNAGLSPVLSHRLHMRRAGVLSTIAYWRTRRGDDPQPTAARAIEELAMIGKSDLDDEDLLTYTEAAVRVGASRLAATTGPTRPGKLAVRTAPGAPGETCVSLYDAKAVDGDKPTALAMRCTYGTVWAASAVSNTEGTALTLAVQPLATWRELWVFRHRASGWCIDVLPPGNEGPGLGYIEFAGWQPGTNRMLIVRELQLGDHFRRRFEMVRLDTLLAERQASAPELLGGFGRSQDPVWRSTTVALR
jgi:hypothetical protein